MVILLNWYINKLKLSIQINYWNGDLHYNSVYVYVLNVHLKSSWSIAIVGNLF